MAEPIDFHTAAQRQAREVRKKGGGGRPKVDNVDLNHDSLALRFAEEHAEKARYNWTTGFWHLWNGHCWQASETGGGIEAVRELLRRVAVESGLPKVRERLGTRGFATAVEGFACSDRRLACMSTDFDPDSWLLATPGGHVDLRTGEMGPARPSSLASRATAVTPDETDEGAHRWRRFLDEATGEDPEMIRYLQQVAGYALTAETSEQALFFVYGPGGNGKSVFVNTLRGIMGTYATHAPMETFTSSGGTGEQHPTALAMLCGARLVTAIETEEGRHWAEARIKALTGGDAITARFMRENFFTFEPRFKLVLVGNHKPNLRSVDEAIVRRFRMLPFERKPGQVDRRLEAALVEEWPAILRWAIDGCLEWQAEGGMASPEAMLRTTAEYLAEQDTVGRWLDSQCEVAEPPYSVLDERCYRTTMSALYQNYRAWIEPQGERARSMKALGMELDKRGFPTHRTSDARWRVGLKLREDAIRPLTGAGERLG